MVGIPKELCVTISLTWYTNNERILAILENNVVTENCDSELLGWLHIASRGHKSIQRIVIESAELVGIIQSDNDVIYWKVVLKYD